MRFVALGKNQLFERDADFEFHTCRLHCNKPRGWGDDNLLLYNKMQSYFNPPPFFFYMKWNQYYLTCDWLKQIQSRNFSKSTAWRRLIIWTMWVSITARALFVKYTSKQIFEESNPLIIHFIQEIIWKANETQIITVTWFIWAK